MNDVPPPIPAGASPKKGLSVLAWAGIGCGGLLAVIVAIAIAGFVFVGKQVGEFAREAEANPAKVAAELAVKFNPDLEVVGTDDAAGTLTFRTKSTGEEVTLSYKDVAEGRFSVKTADGEMTVGGTGDQPAVGEVTMTTAEGTTVMGGGASTLEKTPEWVKALIYPNHLEVQPGFMAEQGGRNSGTLVVLTADGVEAVAGFYRDQLKAAGFVLEEAEATGTDGTFVSLAGKNEAAGRTLGVVAARGADETQVAINFAETGP